MIPNPELFKHTMDQAGILHHQGHFSDAVPIWKDAQNAAPDDLSRGRALRGEASSLERGGWIDEAEIPARTAYNVHTDLTNKSSYLQWAGRAREKVESGRVLSRILLGTIIRGELSGAAAPEAARDLVNDKVEPFLGDALETMEKAEKRQEYEDQHTINLLGTLSITTSLYGDIYKGRELALQLLKRAPWAEGKNNPTSANLGLRHRFEAKGKALLRGASALAINRFVRGPISARRLALKMALHPKLGL